MLGLLKLLGVDTAGYDRWQFSLAADPAAPLLILAALALLAAAVASWWHVRQRQRPSRRRVLLALRWALLALVFALLLEPKLELLKTIAIRSQILVAVDRTPSMSIADAADSKRRMDAVAQVFGREEPWKELEEEQDVRYFLFGGRAEDYERSAASREQLAQGYENAGRETDLAAVMADMAKISRERATAAVILVSDGADLGSLSELREDPGGLSGFLRRNDLLPAAPLSTVLVGGEESFPDLAIRDVRADEYGFIRNKVEVGVDLAAQGVGAQQVPVTIKLGNEIVASQTVELPGGGGVTQASLGFSPTRVGEFVYTVEVPVLAGEKLTANNRREFKIKIIRDKVRVLHVVGRPSWDERFLRRTLKEDPNIDLVSFMILRELVQIPFREDELSLIPFPTEEIFDKKLHTFDLVIFQNFQYVPRYGILPKHLENIRNFVRDDGGGFVMIGGPHSFALGQYGGTPMEDILPVSLRFTSSLLEEGKAVSKERFTPQLPPGGSLHPVTRLHFDPQRSAQLWKALPPLDGMNRVGDLMPGAVALLLHPTLRTPGGAPMPVVSAANVGKGRTLAIATDSSWYWHFLPVDGGGTNEVYLSFWREAIRWLTRDPALKQLNVSTDRSRYRPGEAVRAEVSVLDPDYRPVEKAKVTVTISALDGTRICSEKATPLGEGRYETTCTAEGAGYLEVTGEAAGPAGLIGRDTAYIEVVALSREFERTQPDKKLMELLAEQGEGQALQIEDGKLSGDPTVKREQAFRVLGSRDLSLWDTPLALLLVLALLSLEWWLRRRWGMG